MFIFTADIHLTSRPYDEYRWNIFNILRQQVSKGDHVFILGDLTDQKDNHSSKLVNRLADELHSLSQICPVTILKGNHDYAADAAFPFFKFVDQFSNVEYITEPKAAVRDNTSLVFLPHSRNPQEEWKPFLHEFQNADFILLHQAVTGAKVSDSYSMEAGVDPKLFSVYPGLVLAGDIHVPQSVKKVIYCGSPHPINFGDTFTPSYLVYDADGLGRIEVLSIKKEVCTLRSANDLKRLRYRKGDQVRFVVELLRADFPDWDTIRKAVMDFAQAQGFELCGLELKEIKVQEDKNVVADRKVSMYANPQVLQQFAAHAKLDKGILKTGLALLEKVDGIR